MADIGKVKVVEQREIALDQITIGQRLRPVSEAGVQAVLVSYEEIGRILSPVWLRKVGAKLELLDGAHRLEAATRLELEAIPAIVFSCNAQQAKFLEIDGNLAGAELTPLDTAIFMAERKRLYETAHPETKAGHAGALARWDGVDVVSFGAVTAEKFGMSERHVRRMVQAGEILDVRDCQMLRNAPKPVTLKDLTEIGKITSPVERYDVVEALSAGRAKSAADARRAFAAKDAPEAAPKDPVEEAFKGMMTAWTRAPMAARRRFIEEIGGDMLAMQNGGTDV